MRFSIFSHAPHKKSREEIFSYAPYVREMNLWIANFEEIRIIAPPENSDPEPNELAYKHPEIKLVEVPGIYFKTSFDFLKSSFKSLWIILVIFKEMIITDHIHIRCPGNIGLLACIVQVFFPMTKKTVKYAGNWDPESEQPFSYRLQRWIISNRFLTRNIKVLVYGHWDGMKNNPNLVSFFTASFSNADKLKIDKDFCKRFRFVYLGSLVKGKRPMLAIRIIEELRKRGHEVYLDLFGDGPERKNLEKEIGLKDLHGLVTLWGSTDMYRIKKELLKAHFVILPSKSEGWPKAIAEGMFYGCVPVATRVSCVPWMLDHGNRGILIPPEGFEAANLIETYLENPERLRSLSGNAQIWSRQYSLEYFEESIRRFI